jgi:hypothetical protein
MADVTLGMRNINRAEERPNVRRKRKQELNEKCRKRISKTNNNLPCRLMLVRSLSYCAVSDTAQSQILVLSTVDRTGIARYKIVNWVFHNYALRGYDIFKHISHISVAPRANSCPGNTKYGSRSRQPKRANAFEIQLLTICLLFQVPK